MIFTLEKKFILTNTQILKNHNARQCLFILKKMPSMEDGDSSALESYEKLLKFYTSHYLSHKRLHHWRSLFSKGEDSYQSIHVFFLSLFLKNEDKYNSELYLAKISLLDSKQEIENSLNLFIKDSLHTLDDRHRSKNIKAIITFKIGISFHNEKTSSYTFDPDMENTPL